jgi:hypothetical protein
MSLRTALVSAVLIISALLPSLGYRPPAPMTMEAIAQQLPTSAIMQ